MGNQQQQIEEPKPATCEYNGSVVNGKRQGKGKLVCSDMTYEGEFENDMFNGKGSLNNGKNFYVGNFVDGKAEG